MMYLNKIGSFAFVLCISNQALAAVQPVRMTSQESVPAPRWMFDPLEKKAKNLTPGALALQNVKRAQLSGKFLDCVNLVRTARAQAKSLAPWLAVVELDCATQNFKNKGSAETLATVLASVDHHPEWFLFGPQSAILKTTWVQAQLSLLEADAKGNRARAWTTIENLQQAIVLLDAPARARLYRQAGELSFMQQKLEAARDFFTRSLKETDKEADAAELRTRISVIDTSLNRKIEKETGLKPQAPTGDANLESTPEELELVRRVTSALSSGDVVPAVEDALKLIHAYPGGTRAKWATDRVQEVYLSVIGRDDQKYLLLREQIIKMMERADSDRLYDWARAMQSHLQFEDAYRLAKRSLSGMEGSARSTKAYELAAGAAFHSEKYAEAKDLYSTLILQHAGTDSARLALLRIGLIDFRLAQYASSISDFERLLAMPQTDNYELTARYWLWRSLQKIKAERAPEQMAILIDKFPFSYYGIRARAERDKGIFSWPAPDKKPEVETQIWLTDSERLSWERLQLLLQAGWLDEAQAELKTLPTPQRPEDKALRARLYAAALNYSPAIKMVGEAWDENPSLREEPFLGVSFPTEFRSLITKQASLRGLNPYLVMGLIKQESAFAPRAMSTSPAYGLMQMIAPTAREIAGDLKIDHLQIPEDLYTPAQNIPMGTYYLSKVLKQFDGHIPLALASYNAGPQKVARWLKSRPSLAGLSKSRSSEPIDELWMDELPWNETSYYVKAILRNQLMYEMLDRTAGSGSISIGNPTWLQTPKSAPQ